MIGPEDDWEQRMEWAEERRREGREHLTEAEIADIKADEAYDEGS